MTGEKITRKEFLLATLAAGATAAGAGGLFKVTQDNDVRYAKTHNQALDQLILCLTQEGYESQVRGEIHAYVENKGDPNAQLNLPEIKEQVSVSPYDQIRFNGKNFLPLAPTQKLTVLETTLLVRSEGLGSQNPQDQSPATIRNCTEALVANGATPSPQTFMLADARIAREKAYAKEPPADARRDEAGFAAEIRDLESARAYLAEKFPRIAQQGAKQAGAIQER